MGNTVSAAQSTAKSLTNFALIGETSLQPQIEFDKIQDESIFDKQSIDVDLSIDHSSVIRDAVSNGGCPVDHSIIMNDSTPSSESPIDHSTIMENVASQGGCPVDHTALIDNPEPVEKCPVDHTAFIEKPASTEGCPIDHNSMIKECPVDHNSTEELPLLSEIPSECPMHESENQPSIQQVNKYHNMHF